jgi:hypothetical protein
VLRSRFTAKIEHKVRRNGESSRRSRPTMSMNAPELTSIRGEPWKFGSDRYPMRESTIHACYPDHRYCTTRTSMHCQTSYPRRAALDGKWIGAVTLFRHEIIGRRRSIVGGGARVAHSHRAEQRTTVGQALLTTEVKFGLGILSNAIGTYSYRMGATGASVTTGASCSARVPLFFVYGLIVGILADASRFLGTGL